MFWAVRILSELPKGRLLFEVLLMIASAAGISSRSLDQIRSDFLDALPRITTHARCYFRHLRCKHRKADCISEMVALCWRWWLRLIQRGKNPKAFVSTIATFAARHVQAGRRLCGQDRAKDVLSARAQQRHGFAVGKLPDFDTLTSNPLSDALIDNTQSSVLDQVICRWPRWLQEPFSALRQGNRASQCGLRLP
ncbi:hypothetical protein AYO40_00750 [Planctomycetaceae bacterium SCGC AG-212-D15]|nr:hypothetical protein AYO40_00750 [Planctomycetaceae bacterium SCGC AG-212-D15]